MNGSTVSLWNRVRAPSYAALRDVCTYRHAASLSLAVLPGTASPHRVAPCAETWRNKPTCSVFVHCAPDAVGGGSGGACGACSCGENRSSTRAGTGTDTWLRGGGMPVSTRGRLFELAAVSAPLFAPTLGGGESVLAGGGVSESSVERARPPRAGYGVSGRGRLRDLESELDVAWVGPEAGLGSVNDTEDESCVVGVMGSVGGVCGGAGMPRDVPSVVRRLRCGLDGFLWRLEVVGVFLAWRGGMAGGGIWVRVAGYDDECAVDENGWTLGRASGVCARVLVWEKEEGASSRHTDTSLAHPNCSHHRNCIHTTKIRWMMLGGPLRAVWLPQTPPHWTVAGSTADTGRLHVPRPRTHCSKQQ